MSLSAFARCSASFRQNSAVSFVFFLFAIVSEKVEDVVQLHLRVLNRGQDSQEGLPIRGLVHVAECSEVARSPQRSDLNTPRMAMSNASETSDSTLAQPSLISPASHAYATRLRSGTCRISS
ncbi:MAG: hypothetical protein ACRDNM_06850, partial [Gaiellaceae bacterium]